MTQPSFILRVGVRRLLVIAAHVVLWALAAWTATLLRFEFAIPGLYRNLLEIWLPLVVASRVTTFMAFGLFRGLWRYTGARDLVGIVAGTVVGSAGVLLVDMLIGLHFPRSILAIEWLLAIVLVGGTRLSTRGLRKWLLPAPAEAAAEGGKHRILIVGAGDAGEMLLREIQRNHGSRYKPIGFVDDDAAKVREHIHGVRVLGKIPDLPRLVQDRRVDEVLIAIPSATGRQMRRVVEQCKAAGVRFQTIPGMDQLIDGRITMKQLRNVAIEDLLGREPVELEMEAISRELTGQVIMVTGAGGSIGSEICRQLCRFEPASLLLVERAENSLFFIHRELEQAFPRVHLVPCIGDVGDGTRMADLFELHRPTVVFHAAAHKHVPMMEWNPGEAVKNNVGGTKVIADLSDQFRVHRFVMISTDKAVNPTSVMGVSKRVAEMYVQALSQRSKTRFVTVRFGNVLGSNGSVIPIFQAQIAAGGPVTVTHPEMKRYFMTIPEASQLVLQAGAMGAGGEIFILDMGEPVKIADLAHDLITLSGLKPGVDIEIEFTGVRPGEKLFEELSVDAENTEKTRHPKIFVGRFRPCAWDALQRHLHELASVADEPKEVRRKFLELVPEYRPHAPSATATIRTIAGRRAAND
ncbi:MAG: nucleoside-diphosphate sugar epimerase/dehydratase [Anaeromyxobacter sp.]